jgi:hypothetical protein
MRFMFFGVAFGQMDFLQIPPHDGHPCPWLALPLIGCAEDSHLLDLRPTGRTTEKPHAFQRGAQNKTFFLNQ